MSIPIPRTAFRISEVEGIHDYGILRAWEGNAFWNFRRQGGLKMELSMVGYGYFLELPNKPILLVDHMIGHVKNVIVRDFF